MMNDLTKQAIEVVKDMSPEDLMKVIDEVISREKITKENEIISEVISDMERSLYHASKKYDIKLKPLMNEGVEINGFTFIKDTWAWIIFKPTDLDKQPEYKGKPLVKIVPMFVDDKENIVTILKAQHWTYL